ncbi:MAG: hypothetical protein P4L50_01905 [Anaerolineaceae bacterium]|nr:hypothetical protein [Anaerolineaceae bacterium]
MLTDNQISQISFYKQELLSLGYTPGQIEDIIRGQLRMTNLTKLNNEQYEQLIAGLKAYLIFGRKCHQIE